MKKTLLAIAALFVFATQAHAAAELPKSSVWFEPASAAAGEKITLNALVYNNQAVDATVTVVFSSGTATIATVSAAIPKATAKTVSADWTMPEKNTAVTAKVAAAIDASKKSVKGLVGTLGTATVGVTSSAPTIGGFDLPGSKQISAWFAPLLAKTEAFRIKESRYFVHLKNTSQANIDANSKDSVDSEHPALDDKNIASKAAGNPFEYVTLAYATVGAFLFGSQAIFYVAIALVFLLVLRGIVNLFF